jgi:serine/threonine protein kinase
LLIFFFYSNAFCSLGDLASNDFTSQSGGGSAVFRHLSSDVPAKEDNCSSVFLNVDCENDSGSYCHIQQIPRYNADKSDSFIVFETSSGQELENEVDDDCDSKHSCDDGIDIKNSNRGTHAYVSSCTRSHASSKCLSAWSEEIKRKRSFSTNECHEAKKKIGHKRPLSLDLSSGGGVMTSSPKPSRMYLFIQMQLCRRESLKEWLRDQPDRSTDTVLQMFDQIVQAVEYVHVQGMIHRDLKVRTVRCGCTD